jgi:GH18 family chitinase
MIKTKAKYILDERLESTMIWSLDSDSPRPKSLLSAQYKVFHA